MELLERLCINKYVILCFFSFTTEKKTILVVMFKGNLLGTTGGG